MTTILSSASAPLTDAVRPACGLMVQMLIERLDQHLVDERRLAAPADAGNARERADRNLDVEPVDVVGLGLLDRKKRARLAAVLRNRDELPPRKIRAGQATWDLAMISSSVPIATMLPPSAPAPGPMSTTTSASRIVSSSCSMTISVLPRSRSVLSVAKQPRVIALMQSDRRFVQDVQHADERRTDLRRQTNALRFAARKRRRRARKIQISEADVGQESRAARELL